MGAVKEGLCFYRLFGSNFEGGTYSVHFSSSARFLPLIGIYRSGKLNEQ